MTNEVIEATAQPAQAVQVASQVPADISPAALLATAVNRGATIEELDRLLQLQERMEKSAAARAYNEAFSAFRAEAVEIIKRKRVHFTSQKGTTDYKHAELSDVIEAVSPALAKHGFSFRFIPKQSKDWIEITCELKHSMGHSEVATLGGPPDASGNKNPVQQIASTVTMLQRQTLKAVCGVSEKGDDTDGRPPVQREESAGAGEVEALRDAGQAAAMNGTDALNKWWGSLNAKQRGLMNSDFGAMRKAARAADGEGAQQ